MQKSEKIQDTAKKIISEEISALKRRLNSFFGKVVLFTQNFLLHPLAKKIYVVSLILIALFLFLFVFPVLLQKGVVNKGYSFSKTVSVDSIQRKKDSKTLEKEISRLQNKLKAFTPRSHYLIINSTRNEFFLLKGNELIRQGRCSTGSYLQLEKGENQKWLFKTPKGEFRIRGKTTSPVWKKPDWAFVEEGLPVPSPNHSSRFEYGVLGDYALSLGHGYLIHGTLYQRYLGLPVTHGCVRLNDDDLEKIYRSLDIGSKVFIY